MTTTAVPEADLDFFEREGYLVIEDVLSQELEVEPVIAEYLGVLETWVDRWMGDGTISSPYAELPFPQRLARILAETGPSGFNPFDISLPTSDIAGAPLMHSGPALFNILTSPRLLDLAEQIVGPEIALNPIQRARLKPPERLLPSQFRNVSGAARAGWHQDQGVALPEIDDTNVITVWVAITDATEENGCLAVVPGSHRRGLVTHCPGAEGIVIPDKLLGAPAVPLPVRSGGVLVLNKQTIHGSLTNTSDAIRWSFDIRYQPIGQPTGRPFFPSFVVRSRKDPDSVVRDWRDMASIWAETAARLRAQGFNPPAKRWDGSEALCA